MIYFWILLGFTALDSLNGATTQTPLSTWSTLEWNGTTLSYVNISNRPEPEFTPWYLKNVSQSLQMKSLSEMKVNQSEFSSMLSRIDAYLHLGSKKGYRILSGPLVYTLDQNADMENFVLEQNLCFQNDVLRRISCKDRCGEVPVDGTFPVQCACDEDCFLKGDCCEDINVHCQEVFIQTILKVHERLGQFSYPTCYEYGKTAVFNLYNSQQTDPSNEPKLSGIDCRGDILKSDFIDNILKTLDNTQCGSRSLNLGSFKRYRECGRPDVVVCELPKKTNEYIFSPLHLLCYKNSATRPLINNYNDLQDMEVISQHRDCFYLREISDPILAYSRNNFKAPTNLWHKNIYNKIEVTMAIIEGQTFVNLETKDWKNVQCTGGLKPTDWTCEMNECYYTQLFDDDYKLCFWPDFADLQVTTFPDQNSELPKINSEVTNEKDAAPSLVQTCSCLKSQAVVDSIGWWQALVDTRALRNGHCKLNLYPNALRLEVPGKSLKYENETAPSNLTLSDFLGINFLSQSSNPQITRTSETGNTSTTNFLAQQLEILWASRKNECEPEISEDIRICFSLTKFAKFQPKCFVLEETSTYIRPNKNTLGIVIPNCCALLTSVLSTQLLLGTILALALAG